MKDKKQCLECEIEIYKKTNCSKDSWLNRVKYCSKHCRSLHMKVLMKNRNITWWAKISEKKMWHTQSEEARQKISDSHKGKIIPLSVRIKMSLAKQIWDNKHIWRWWSTPQMKRIRESVEYKKWRTEVFARDNYTCILCHQVGGELNADHIKPFAYFPELRFSINNGRTLCIHCHRKTDTFWPKARKYLLA